jgi:negative regulator of genetic competence, sporulation and motility
MLTLNDCRARNFGRGEFLDPQTKGHEVVTESSPELSVEQEIWYDKLKRQAKQIF